jgi:hypothetical protein
MSVTITTTLLALQDALATLLGADAFYSGLASLNGKSVPIITEKKATITSQIEIALGQVGLCAVILTPSFELHQHETQDLSGFASATIQIYEDTPVNQGLSGTGIQAIQLAERTVAITHWAPHGVYTGPTAPQPSGSTRFLAAQVPISYQSNGPPLQYHCHFIAHVTLNPTLT